MTRTPSEIAGLLGSRICHDLISPLGAIANGVELLTMTGNGDTLDVQLIDDSVQNANAKIRFFRVAFGMAADDQRMSAADIRAILQDMFTGSRVQIDWQVNGDLPREEVKLAFLLIQCLETALMTGGQITVTSLNSRWMLEATSDRIRIEPGLWDCLTRGDVDDVTPAQVHFVLAALLIFKLGRRIGIDHVTDRIAISV